MTSYISRWTRWWVRITELDPTFFVTETLLSDCLLDCAGRTPDQKLMILTSTSNVKTRHVIEIALRKQRSRLHENEPSYNSRTVWQGNREQGGARRGGRFPPRRYQGGEGDR